MVSVSARGGPITTNRPGEGGEKNGVVAPSTDPRGDGELARRLRDGDGEALATLYDRYAANVHGLAQVILRDDRLVEEVTHDVFLGLWRQPGTYDAARGPFVGWLLRVARNRAIDLLRRRRERPFAADATLAEGIADRLVDPDPDPADQATASLDRRAVRAALERLTPDQRRLLELAYFDGLTQREIAARLDRPLGTVKSQIRTAMQRMADLLVGSAPPFPSLDPPRPAQVAAGDEP